MKGKAGQKISILPFLEKKNKEGTLKVWLKPQKLPKGGKAFFSPEEATSVGPALSPALEKRRQFMAQGTTLK